MKKLFFASVFALATLTACQTETQFDEIVTARQESNTMAARSGEVDYLAKDGYMYFYNNQAYYMGEELKEETGEDVDLVAGVIRSSETNRDSELGRNPRIQCKFTTDDGTKIYLTQVSGGGAPSTYWVSYVRPDGTIHTYRNPGVDCNLYRNQEEITEL